MHLFPCILLFCGSATQMFVSATATIDEIIAAAGGDCPSNAPSCSPSGTIKEELDILIPIPQNRRRKKRKGLVAQTYRWADKIVPYEIDPFAGFTSSQINTIKAAMAFWSDHTCIQFVERTTQSDYIFIFSDTGCYSYVGRQGGSQKLSLGPGCRIDFIIEHELAHALGEIHEQGRSDRDQFVTVKSENIMTGQEHNFNIWQPTSSIGFYGTIYDYLSVMHYGPRGFSKNGLPTLEAKNPAYQDLIGTSREPSFTDIKVLNGMYQCAAHCPGTCSQPRAFMDKNCDCVCPGSHPVLATQQYGPCADTDPQTTVETTVTDDSTDTTTVTEPTTTATPTTTAPTTTGSVVNPPFCINWSFLCYPYQSLGFCLSNPFVMRVYCPRACGLC